jgi:hypothetical protein
MAFEPQGERRVRGLIAGLGAARSACCPFRANEFAGGRVSRAMPWADAFEPFGLEDRSRFTPTACRHQHGNTRACPFSRRRRNDSPTQGNALGTGPQQTSPALKGRNSVNLLILDVTGHGHLSPPRARPPMRTADEPQRFGQVGCGSTAGLGCPRHLALAGSASVH